MEVELLSDLFNVLSRLLSERIRIITALGAEEKYVLRNIDLLSMGAEAIIARCTFLDIDAVIKWRFPKPYIPPELDKDFRKTRTATEAKALLKAISLNINVPIPLYIDLEEGLIIMTYIDGMVFRDLIEKLSRDEICNVCRTIGIYIARLHENSIIHGDVTTSNILIDKNSEDVYLIDFGLTNFVNRLEDQAIDIHIFFRSVESVHHLVEDLAKQCFIEGYRDIRGDYTDKVLKMVNHIRKMGRYVAERKLRSVWSLK
ncbi:MAG: Kae1-associated kinase Bud32 [Ignisphaera sp.]